MTADDRGSKAVVGTEHPDAVEAHRDSAMTLLVGLATARPTLRPWRSSLNKGNSRNLRSGGVALLRQSRSALRRSQLGHRHGQAIGAGMEDSAPWKTEETIIGLPQLPVLSGFSRFGGCHLELHPGSEQDRFVAVFTTGKIIQFNMAIDALRQAHIPVQTQENTGTGMQLSMPVAPTPGPGVFWSILVPEKALGDARQVLSELPFPITTNPAPWDFLPDTTSEEARADARAGKWIMAIGFLALQLYLIVIGGAWLALGRDRDIGLGMIASGGVLGAIVVAIVWHSRRWSKRHGTSSGSHR